MRQHRVRRAAPELSKSSTSTALSTTPMGAQRAANGHAEPYGVKYWNIGNEMYGHWQMGHMALDNMW